MSAHRFLAALGHSLRVISVINLLYFGQSCILAAQWYKTSHEGAMGEKFVLCLRAA